MLVAMKNRAPLLAAFLLAVVQMQGQNVGSSITVPKGQHVLTRLKGDGVQIYTCTETDSGKKWVLKGPEAKLLDASGKVVGSHSAGPTWELDDGGKVQGQVIGNKPRPDQKAVAWLLLKAKEGTASGSLGKVTFIQRTKTHGGVAGADGCKEAANVGSTVRIPYHAIYTFYTAK